MERLTKDKRTMCIVEDNQNKNYFNQIHDKLSKLEDLEDELGISLEVLFKALKDGIYYDYKHIEPEDVSFRFYYKELIVRYTCYGETDYDYLELKDYGKTWWLEKPKEELGNDKD